MANFDWLVCLHPRSPILFLSLVGSGACFLVRPTYPCLCWCKYQFSLISVSLNVLSLKLICTRSILFWIFRELLRLFISVLVLGRTRTSFSHLGLFRLLFLNVEFTPLSQHTESLFICFGGGMYCHWSISEGGDISRNSWRKLYKNPAKINP